MAGGGRGPAAVIAGPNLVWQATNGWPQFEMADALAARLAAENRITLLPLQILFFGPFVVMLLWWGARWLRRPAGRAFQPLLWAWPAGLVLVLVSGGRPYYMFPLTLVVGLAGVVDREQQDADLRRLGWLVVANAVVSIPLALPVLPPQTAGPLAAINETNAETIGWPSLVAQVADVVHRLPADEQSGVVLLTASYGEAGAIDRFGSAHGLPPAYSPHNSYADFRQPTDENATVVAVRYSTQYLSRFFDRCDQVATVTTPYDTDNEIRGVPIVVCRGLRAGWDATWAQLRFLS